MSKASSGLFTNTLGYASETLSLEAGIRPLHSTAEIWNHIEATDASYPGTPIPKSFVVNTPGGNFWAHPNGTKHMEEALNSIKELPALKNTNPSLFSQFILYDFRQAVIAATMPRMPTMGKVVRSGHWELVFNKRPSDKYPVVMHAQFLGLD